MNAPSNKLAILTLVLGLALGGLAGWLVTQSFVTDTVVPRAVSSDLPDGFKKVTLAEAGLEIATRNTDQLSRLTNEDKSVGFKVSDQFAKTTGAYVEIITTRLEEFYDLPAATTLVPYRDNVSGLNIQKTVDVSLNGFVGIKQLYNASIGQKRSDGSIIKQPVNNLMRYVLQAPDGRIILVKSTGTFQAYLDSFVTHLKFIPINSPANTDSGVSLDPSADEVISSGATSDQLFDNSMTNQGLNLQ